MVADVASAVIRALSFITLFQGAGVAIFIALFGREVGQSLAAVRRVGFVSAVAGIVFVAVHYSLEAARMAGALSGVLDVSLQQLVLDSPMSAALGARTAGLALIAVAIVRDGMRWTRLAVAGAAVAIGGFLFVGHTASDPARQWLAILLFLHLAVVAFWFGALVSLHIVSRSEPAAVTAGVVDHFSRIAIWWVPAILLAGIGMTLLLVDAWSVFGEAYGALLLVKITGFAALMALAGLNKRRYGPAIATAPRVLRVFQRAVAAEYALVCAILSATAVMTTFFSPEH